MENTEKYKEENKTNSASYASKMNPVKSERIDFQSYRLNFGLLAGPFGENSPPSQAPSLKMKILICPSYTGSHFGLS